MPKIIQECGRNGTKVGVVITAGFGEVDRKGKSAEEEMVALARSLGMRLVGPNCQGIVSTWNSSLYAHMPPQFPPTGPLGVVSQSGNLATSLIEAGRQLGIGFSRIISSGNEADLQTPDFLEFLAEDPKTEVILSYLEGLKDGRKFFQTASKVSVKKPFLMVKAGQTEAGVKAAFSHTGALAGSAGLSAAFAGRGESSRLRPSKRWWTWPRLSPLNPCPGEGGWEWSPWEGDGECWRRISAPRPA